jgi:hypothetical protein
MNHPMRNRATCAIKAFVAGLLTLTMLSAALAQSGGAPFNRFAPTGVMEVGGNRNAPQVFTPLPNAVGRFDGGWTRHRNFTNVVPENSWDNSFVVLASYAPEGGRRFYGFFGFQDRGTQRVAIPYWETDIGGQWIYRTGTLTPPNHPTDGQGFSPQAGFVWQDPNRRRRLNVFGTVQRSQGNTVPAAIPPNSLRELYWDGQWRWTDHGRPDGTGQVLMGSNAALWNPLTQQGRVFVAAVARPAVPTLGPSIHMRFYDPAVGWTWWNLGSPLDRRFRDITGTLRREWVSHLSAPVAVSRVENGIYKVNVFVVGMIQTSERNRVLQYRWELFERYWNGAIWVPWKSYGPVPGTSTWMEFQDSQAMGGGAMMTSGVVWHSGTTLRVDLFGHTMMGDLLEFFWDGSVWGWAPRDRPPGGAKIRTTSSIVHESGADDRRSVYSRAESGEVWERTFDTRIGRNPVWRRLLR